MTLDPESMTFKKINDKKEQNGSALGKNINEMIESKINKFLDFIIISSDSKCYLFFISIINVFCVVTSYYYMYVSAFGGQTMAFEVLFLFDMILNFFVDYTDENYSTGLSVNEGGSISVKMRDFRKIAIHYFHNNFIHDMVPLIPLQYIYLPMNSQRIFYLIKCYRLKRGLKEANVHVIMSFIKNTYMERIKKFAENNPDIAKDPVIDNNKMMQIMMITLLLRTLKLVILIMNFSYFIGMGWFIMCQTI